MKRHELIRPANMRLAHGLRSANSLIDLSVSSAMCVEKRLADPMMARESGAGMDAPEDIPSGSLKAFFDERNGGIKYCFGFCQRTVRRAK